MPGGTATLKVRDLTVAFGQVVAVRDVSLTAREGETVAIFGANGSGKTTFLKAVAGLIPATRGRVAWRGEDVTALPAHERAARGIRYVSDRSRVATRMTVLENLEAGAWLLPPSRWSAARDRVFSLFPALAKVARSPAGVLSGGERQMLILGRALVAEPTLLLMDEPFLGLSREVRDRLLSVIEGTLKGQATIVFAEHDAEGAYRLLDRHVIFRNGSLVHEGTRSDVADAKELVSLLYRHFRPGILGGRRSTKENERKRHERDDGRGKGERGAGTDIGDGDAAVGAGRSAEGVLPQLPCDAGYRGGARAGRIFPRGRDEPLNGSPAAASPRRAGLRSWLAVR